MVVGQVLYPVGWASRMVINLCGRNAGAFLIDDCQIGKLCEVININTVGTKKI